MTAKRDSKRKSKERKRPKLEKDRLKDLDADGVADEVKGGAVPTAACTGGCQMWTDACRTY
jgi:hypothetical protein